MKTNEVKHTPGPWHIDLEGPFILGGDSREVVALTSDGMVERQICQLMFDTDEYPTGKAWLEDAANARLIAAAPELLEALESLCKRVRIQFDFDSDTPISEALKEAKSAIAKAKGETV